MIVLKGTGVSRGIARGTIRFYQHTVTDISDLADADPLTEKQRFINAKDRVKKHLTLLAEDAKNRIGSDASLLFQTHAMIVEDAEFIHRITACLQEGYSAEYAVQKTGQGYADLFRAMNDPYLQLRADDILDLTGQLIRALMQVKPAWVQPDESILLATDDLTPSELLHLDSSKILGIAMKQGSDCSHTTLLARGLGIPAICNLGDLLSEAYNGEDVFMDGTNGELIVSPDQTMQSEITRQIQSFRGMREHLLKTAGTEDLTIDGHTIHILCNIQTPSDVSAVLENQGSGIGLFRSEFLFLSSDHLPDEEEQFRAYQSVASAMEGKPVVIRTLDLGADKQIEGITSDREENPALGLRGIRLCLKNPDLFRTQLRAIYRASAFGQVSILFPMITSLWEVEQCKKFCQEVMKELQLEGIAYDPSCRTGIMIETPAAVLQADRLALEVDFFSIGTNDLTQYLLACDRRSVNLKDFDDAHHPAVLSAIRIAAEAGHSAGIPVGICGELAADQELLDTWLDIGIDDLSVVPSCVLPLRAEIKKKADMLYSY